MGRFRSLCYTEDELLKIRESLERRKKEKATKPKGRRPPVTPNFSSGRRRSAKQDEFGFDVPAKIDLD
jgi:hypothetical protein